MFTVESSFLFTIRNPRCFSPHTACVMEAVPSPDCSFWSPFFPASVPLFFFFLPEFQQLQSMFCFLQLDSFFFCQCIHLTVISDAFYFSRLGSVLTCLCYWIFVFGLTFTCLHVKCGSCFSLSSHRVVAIGDLLCVVSCVCFQAVWGD